MYSVSLIDYNSTPTSERTICKKELCIYDPRTMDEGRYITNPTLSLKSSQAGEFSCSIPETNYGYGKIIKKVTRVIVRRDNKVIYMGRINDEDKDLYLNETITSEGALAYLNDSLTEKKVYTNKTLFQILKDIFDNHNSKFPYEPWKQFILEESNCYADFVGRDITDVTSNKITYYNVNYFNSLQCISELLDLATAVLKIEYDEENGNWKVYIFKKYELPVTSNQPIEFRKNLLDITQTQDETNKCSAVAPFGGDVVQESKEVGEAIAGYLIESDNKFDFSTWANVVKTYTDQGTNGIRKGDGSWYDASFTMTKATVSGWMSTLSTLNVLGDATKVPVVNLPYTTGVSKTYILRFHVETNVSSPRISVAIYAGNTLTSIIDTEPTIDADGNITVEFTTSEQSISFNVGANDFTEGDYATISAITIAEKNDIFDYILRRGVNDHIYTIVDVHNDPVYGGNGYWAFEFDIASYNAAHPTNPLKRLYLSWRGYFLEVSQDYVADAAWMIVQRYVTGDEILANHIYENNGEMESAINEVIDLSDPQYTNATHILMFGWSTTIRPLIRRDAAVVEENDKLTIEKCDAIDDDQYIHEAGSPYLISKEHLNQFGLIEKKLEYEIEDELKKLSTWVIPYSGDLGIAKLYNTSALGYDAGDGTDFNSHKGDYKIVPFVVGYTCLEYELPELGSPKRPRGVYISSRMHPYGVWTSGGKNWLINGMYVILDAMHMVLAYRSANDIKDGIEFTSIKDEYIDLSDAKYYGAKYIRVGGFTGGLYNIAATPTDDEYSRNRLLEQAKLYLTRQQPDKIVIEASAVDLSVTSDQWDAFDICTNAEVYSAKHKIQAVLQISELNINLESFEENTITLGYNNEEYLSTQLSEELRLISVEETIKERRNNL